MQANSNIVYLPTVNRMTIQKYRYIKIQDDIEQTGGILARSPHHALEMLAGSMVLDNEYTDNNGVTVLETFGGLFKITVILDD